LNHAVILAGGERVRLQGLAGGLSKALVEVGGVPLLGRQLYLLAAQGFAEVAILGSNITTPEAQARFNKIVGYREDDSRWGWQIQCLDKRQPLCMADVLAKLAANFHAPFFVLYADTVLDIHLARMWHAHSWKPATGFLDRAKRDFNADMPASWMIGDQTPDIELARRVGLRSILVLTGLAGRDGRYRSKPDFVAQDFTEAVDIILETTGNGHHRFDVKPRNVSSSSDQFLREDNDYQ
jgi:HAD-hyrolase-like/MobA-like NTP transferase domain